MTKGIPLRGTLAGFSTLDQPLRWADVLVIGSGIAGMTVALEASRYGTVLLISKSRMDESNTRWAQGGIAAALDGTEEAYRTHIEDTLVAGAGLAPRSRLCVEFLHGSQSVGRRPVRSADGLIECVVRLSPPCIDNYVRRRVANATPAISAK